MVTLFLCVKLVKKDSKTRLTHSGPEQLRSLHFLVERVSFTVEQQPYGYPVYTSNS